MQTLRIDCKELGVLICKSFPNIPASIASMAIERMVSKQFTMSHAKDLVYNAIDDFVPGYGVAYPSVGYLLGNRSNGAISKAADIDPYGIGDLRPAEDVLREMGRSV